MSPRNAIITRAVRWPGVDAASDGRGRTVLTVAARELAHVHDDGVDLPLTRALRDQLLTDGMADRYRPAPVSEWVSSRVRSQADVADGLRLLRFAYCWRLLEDAKLGGPLGFQAHLDPASELDQLDLGTALRALVATTTDSSRRHAAEPVAD